MKTILLAILACCGLFLFAAGLYMAWKPIGVMTAGLFLFLPAFFVLYQDRERR